MQGRRNGLLRCQTASKKTINLCGTLPGRLQYRYGRPGKIELRFPEAEEEAPRQLSYAHYDRPDTDYVEVGFENGGISYILFDRTEGDSRRGGVNVTLATDVEHSVDCVGKIYSRLPE